MVTKIKKNAVFVKTDNEEIDNVASLKACRKPNNNKELNIAEIKINEIELNKRYEEWIESNDAEKFCFDLKSKFDLQSYLVDNQNMKIVLTGLDNHVDNATK